MSLHKGELNTSQITALPYAVMEGKGAYNRNAKIQVNGAALATPFLEKAARKVQLDLVLQQAVVADYGSSPGKRFADFVDRVNTTIGGMADDGAITAQERARMVLGSYPRRRDELLAPFMKNGEFQRFIVEDCEIAPLPDPAWADYQMDGDKNVSAVYPKNINSLNFVAYCGKLPTEARRYLEFLEEKPALESAPS